MKLNRVGTRKIRLHVMLAVKYPPLAPNPELAIRTANRFISTKKSREPGLLVREDPSILLILM